MGHGLEIEFSKETRSPWDTLTTDSPAARGFSLRLGACGPATRGQAGKGAPLLARTMGGVVLMVAGQAEAHQGRNLTVFLDPPCFVIYPYVEGGKIMRRFSV